MKKRGVAIATPPFIFLTCGVYCVGVGAAVKPPTFAEVDGFGSKKTPTAPSTPINPVKGIIVVVGVPTVVPDCQLTLELNLEFTNVTFPLSSPAFSVLATPPFVCETFGSFLPSPKIPFTV